MHTAKREKQKKKKPAKLINKAVGTTATNGHTRTQRKSE
jgi:hypothetical protein